MRVAMMLVVMGALAVPAAANAAISCSELPRAQAFVDHLRPGPNTRAAQRHLALARQARSQRRCSDELAKADYYARRSAAADRRLSERERRGRR